MTRIFYAGSTVNWEFIKRVSWILAFSVLLVTPIACIYRIDIQQGNLLEETAIEQVSVGMTKSQVLFLLGTPMVADSFHTDRWDYTYYFKRGRSDDIERRWLIVYFDGDVVSSVEKDVPLDPAS